MKFLTLMLLGTIPCLVAAQTYNCKVTSQQELTATVTSTRVLAAKAMRRCLVISNKGFSTRNLWVNFDSATAAGTSTGILIPPSTSWEPIIIPTNSIYIRTNAGTEGVNVSEGQ